MTQSEITQPSSELPRNVSDLLCVGRACRGLVITGMVFTAACGLRAPDNSYQEPPPLEVVVAKPVQQEVTISIEENGDTEPVDRAEVRARVNGFLERILFEPGQSVAAGDVLYVIEQAEYKAAVSSAQAALEAATSAVKVAESQLGVAEVEVTRAEFEFKRLKALLEKEAATQSQYDQALAARDGAVATQEAAVSNIAAAKADQDKAAAQLERARLDLDYTEVKAPIDGRVTKTEIKLGNLVDNGDLLATVVDRSGIYANFNVSDRTLLRLREASRENGEGKGDDDGAALRATPAYLRRGIDQGYPFKGHLDYADQEGVDQATGTFAVRAIFENEDDRLLPGLFVRVKVPVDTLPDALLIPEYALLRDQSGRFVWTVTDDDTLDRRAVEAGDSFGDMIVITHGIDAEDRVLLDGIQRARQGAKVVTSVTTLKPVQMPDAGVASASSDAENMRSPAAAGHRADSTPKSEHDEQARGGTAVDPNSESKP